MNTIEFGDCREIMKKWAKKGVKAQMCVTSPPYFGLRSYVSDESDAKKYEVGSEETPQQYVQNLVEVFRAVRDLLDDTGTLWINISDSYAGSHGNGSVAQSHGQSKFVKFKSPTANVKGVPPKNLLGIPWRLAFALQDDGWVLRQDIIWSKNSCMPESVTDRCTKSHEYIFLLSKKPDYFFDHEAIRERATSLPHKPGNTSDKDAGHLRNDVGTERMAKEWGADGLRNKRSVWTVNPKPYKGAHFAVYPEELIEPCVLSGSRKGDTVLDPFMGSGTTAAVAIKFGRKYLGCELNPEYGKLQQQRIKQKQLSPTVKVAAFSAHPTKIGKLF